MSASEQGLNLRALANASLFLPAAGRVSPHRPVGELPRLAGEVQRLRIQRQLMRSRFDQVRGSICSEFGHGAGGETLRGVA